MTALSIEVHDEMLDIIEPHAYDENIQSMQFHEYTPQTQANDNTVGHPIRIDLNLQDVYCFAFAKLHQYEGSIA